MTSPIGTKAPRSGEPRPPGFTLIELILVMALLTIVIAVAAPTLSRFFRGRTLESEAARFLALTRHGQSRAVAEGVPMVLWLDPAEGAYYLREEIGFGPEADNRRRGLSSTSQSLRAAENEASGEARVFHLSDKLRFELLQGSQGRNQGTAIRFTPDGAIEADSPRTVLIREEDRGCLAIRLAAHGLSYEIRQQTNAGQMFSR
jgi:type IV fimbrial biogenesis protein FimT